MRLPLLVAFSFGLLAFGLLVPTAHAAKWRVKLDGTGDVPTIQDALDLAGANGHTVIDTVLVGPGVYTWDNQGTGDQYGLIRFWQSDQDDVHLIAEEGPEVTILDAQYHGRVIFSNGNNITGDPVEFLIQGFTIRNGIAPSYPNRPEQEGGGFVTHQASPTVRDCTFRNNRAEFGGGIWCGGVGSYKIEYCRFVGNLSITSRAINPVGGGLFMGGSVVPKSTVIGCEFINNRAGYRGGGFFAQSMNLDVVDCVFTRNYSTDTVLGNGTAFYGFWCESLKLDGILVRNNDTQYGAAVLLRGEPGNPFPVEIVNSVISYNAPDVGIRATDVSLDVRCTNISGHVGGNWIGLMAPFADVDGNSSVDPRFCGGPEIPQWVKSSSPLLAANNSCGVDLGLAQGGCSIVPTAVSTFEAQWESGRATVSLDLADARLDPLGWSLLRYVDGTVAAVAARFDFAGGAWRCVDPDAPTEGASYRLLDDTGLELARAELPARPEGGFAIESVRPNPFNPRTEVQWNLPTAGYARLEVFDLKGRRVGVLFEGPAEAGLHSSTWDAHDARGARLASGTYLLRLTGGLRVRTQKIALLQ